MADDRQEDFDELLIERNRKGHYWVHFAVRPKDNRRKTKFIEDSILKTEKKGRSQNAVALLVYKRNIISFEEQKSPKSDRRRRLGSP